MATKRKAQAALKTPGVLRALEGKVESADSGLQGFDTNTIVTPEAATAFRQQDFRFCIRYLSRFSPQSGRDLSLAEAQAILNGGLSQTSRMISTSTGTSA